jgi:GUN4-like
MTIIQTTPTPATSQNPSIKQWLMTAIVAPIVTGIFTGIAVLCFQQPIFELIGVVKLEDRKEVIDCKRELNNKGFPELEPLCDPLKNKFGKRADHETYNVIGKMIYGESWGQKGKTTYNVDDIINYVGCPALKEIDELWKSASSGKLGFSAQYEVWSSVDKNYKTFGRDIDWVQSDGTPKRRLNYELGNSPQKGHLPALWNQAPGDKAQDSNGPLYSKLFDYIEACRNPKNNWTDEAGEPGKKK